MAGQVTLSLEIELGWGVHDINSKNKYNALSNQRKEESKTLDKLLAACDQLNIPISFDIVGHLLERSCDGRHPDAPHDPSWFSADPGGNVTSDPLFYAPDLIQSIVDASVNHEICTHTYSHVLCDSISSASLNWELKKVAQVHEEFGLSTPSSLVPPRGRVPSLETLADNGIEAIRVPYLGTAKSFTKLNYLRSAISPPVTEPTVDRGVTITHCTPLPSLTSPVLPDGSRPSHPLHATVPIRARQRFHRSYLSRGLKNAIRQDGHVHYWSHLYNMSNEYQLTTVIEFLDELKRAQDRGEANVVTINSIS